MRKDGHSCNNEGGYRAKVKDILCGMKVIFTAQLKLVVEIPWKCPHQIKYLFFLFATRHYNFRFTVGSYCLLCSLLASSFMLTRLINGIVLTSSFSFREHGSRHRVAPRSLLPVQELRFSLRFLTDPSSFTVSNHPYLSPTPPTSSPPHNPLLSSKGSLSLSLPKGGSQSFLVFDHRTSSTITNL